MGKPFPGPLYICLGHKLVRYRNEGDEFTVSDYDKLVLNQVRFLFIEEKTKGGFLHWVLQGEEQERAEVMKDATEEQKSVLESTRARCCLVGRRPRRSRTLSRS